MNTLKQLLLIFAIVVGFSLTAFAQKDDQDKKPPKEKPPVVNPEDKKPPKGEKPSENDRPKKPNAIFVKTENGFQTTFV